MKAKSPKTKKVSTLPVDIKLPEGILLDNGTMFVILRTLDDLEKFWQEHHDQFEFAAEGIDQHDGNIFLRSYEWVFGTSKASVVSTVMRWGQSSIRCEFYDWAKTDPADHAHFFKDRELWRRDLIEEGRWSSKNEADYQDECIRLSPETYRGWWQLKDIPGGCTFLDWFDGHVEEIIDPYMPLAEVKRKMQEQTFDHWRESGCGEVQYHNREDIDQYITYWHEEKAIGRDYYGIEDETTTR
jgi:hypothetical protein